MKRPLPFSDNKFKAFSVFAFLMLSFVSIAQTTITSGNTVAASTITAGNTVTINAGGTLNMDVARTFASITTANSGTSTISGTNALTVSGAITIATSNTLSLNPSCTSASLTSNWLSTTTATISGSGTLTTGAFTIDGGTGGSNDGLFTIASGATVVCTTVNQGGGNKQHNLVVSGTIKVSSTISNIDNITCNTGSTFEYNGTAQSIYTTTYSNLTLSGSSTKTTGASFAVGGTLTVGTGVTLVPGATTHVISGAGTLTGTGTVRVTLVSATALTTQYTITTKTLTGLTVDFAAAGNQSIASTATVGNYGGLTTSGSGTKTLLGAITVNGDITIGTGTTLTVSGSNFAINVGGNWTRTGTFTQGTGTVTFNGNGVATTQVIGGTATTFSTLTIATGAKVRSDVVTVATTFNVNGTGYYIHNAVGVLPGSTTRAFNNTGAVNTQSTIEYQNNTANTAPVSANYGNLIINISSYTSAVGSAAALASIGGDLRIQNTGGQELRLVSTQTTTHSIGGNLSVEGANAILVINSGASGAGTPIVNVTGNLNVSNGVLDLGSGTGSPTFNVTGGVNLSGGTLRRTGTNAVALNVGGNWANTGGTFTPANINVTLNGTTQSITGASATTFNNLTLSGSGTKTFGVAINVTSALSIASGVVANLGTFINTAGSLTLNGSAQGTGSSYGGTGSMAATINSTFFAATLGVVNVGTCGTYSLTGTLNSSTCPGNGAAVTVNGSTGNLPVGTYVVYYTFSGANTGSGSSSMPVSVAGTGSFTTSTLTNSGSTTITIDYIRNGCVIRLTSNNTATINVTAPTSSVISGNATICSGSTTNLQVAITGGTSPYSVVFTGGSASLYTSGSNIPVAPVSPTTYTLTSVTDANGCVGSGNSGSAVISFVTTTSTDGGATWSNGTPAANKSIVFDGSSGTISSNLSGCALHITNSANISVSSGVDVTLNAAIVVDSGSTFTLDNNANLLQGGTTNTNSGDINVNRNSSPLKRLDYTLWSSPVLGQELYAFSTFTFGNRFYVYRTLTNLYNNADVGFNITGLNPDGVNGNDNNDVQFAQAKGYLIRMPWDHPTAATVWNGTFTGVPNNGDITYTMANGGVGQRFNLIGNPYPSPISMSQFVSDNSTNITGTLYFWRETNGNTSNNAYCSWAGGTFTSNGEAQVVNPNGIIRTGQGFFVEALGSATSVDFKNGQRSSDNSNQFFKTGNSNAVNDVTETNRFWLNLTNSAGAFSQMAAGYMTNATDGVDLYDGKNINTGSVLLNSILDNTDYTIQGKALPFEATDVIPLSFKVTNAGSYTITIDHVDGLFTDGTQAIYLKDNLTSTEHNLQTGGYTFTSAAGTFTNRFEIIYQSQLGVVNPIFTANNVVIFNQDNDFVINSGNTIMKSIKVFDIRGRLLQERNAVNANQTTINGGLANGVLLVQITSEDGVIVTKKVIR